MVLLTAHFSGSSGFGTVFLIIEKAKEEDKQNNVRLQSPKQK